MKILVNIDFGSSCGDVLTKAREVAITHKGELSLFHIVTSINCDYIKKAQVITERYPSFTDLIVGFSGGMNYEILRDEAAAILKKEHSKLLELKNECSKSGIKTRAFIMEGNIFETIKFQLEKNNPDLIIIKAEDKKQNNYNKFFGEINGTILRLAKCPVLVLP